MLKIDINNVVSYNLWNQIVETISREKRWGWLQIVDNAYISCCRFDKSWVTDIISKEDARNIRPDTPAFVVTQTGTGKTSFIFKSCLPIAIEEKKKILYLCNRLSLKEQMKKRCMEDELNCIQRNIDSIYIKDMKKYYTSLYLSTTCDFGGIDIFSYQSLIHSYKQIDFQKYSFIIFDEAHFFVSDATFNVYTEAILEVLLKHCFSQRRIYLTATPQECIEEIYKKELIYLKHEKRICNKRQICGEKQMKVYVMDEDYRYLRPYFFMSIKFILEKINRSSKSDSWLIFVRDIATGERLREKLKDIEGGVDFFSAESDKKAQEYVELIGTEKLPKRILISTKVLDVGVNIQSQNLHMVVFEDNVVELKQMIGRKRIKPGESLEVYFCVPDYKELVKRLGQIEKRLVDETNVIKRQSLYKNGYSKDLPHPLYYHDGIQFNGFSIRKMQEDVKGYKKLERILRTHETELYKYMSEYAKCVLSNFRGKNFCDGMILEIKDISDEGRRGEDTIAEILKMRIGKSIDKSELVSLSKEIMAVVGDSRCDKREARGAMGVRSMKPILKEYGYILESMKTTPVTYRISVAGKDDK